MARTDRKADVPDDVEEPAAAAPVHPLTKVRVRFTGPHIHAGLPFAPGDEITIESHWADSIERLGTGYRVIDPDTKE